MVPSIDEFLPMHTFYRYKISMPPNPGNNVFFGSRKIFSGLVEDHFPSYGNDQLKMEYAYGKLVKCKYIPVSEFIILSSTTFEISRYYIFIASTFFATHGVPFGR